MQSSTLPTSSDVDTSSLWRKHCIVRLRTLRNSAHPCPSSGSSIACAPCTSSYRRDAAERICCTLASWCAIETDSKFSRMPAVIRVCSGWLSCAGPSLAWLATSRICQRSASAWLASDATHRLRCQLYIISATTDGNIRCTSSAVASSEAKQMSCL